MARFEDSFWVSSKQNLRVFLVVDIEKFWVYKIILGIDLSLPYTISGVELAGSLVSGA